MNNNSENNNKICHIISGDLWGGAETQAYSIICELSKMGIYNIDVVIFNDGVLYSRLLKNNFNVHLLAEADKNILRMIYAMYILFKKIKPDVIHAHGFKENLIGGIVAKLLKIKLIRTHHGIGMINGKLVYRLIEIINGRFLTNCIISVSEDLKKLLIKNNICNSGARVIRNGLNCTDASSDINVDELRNELGIDKKAYVIGTMGRMVPVKNHKCLIDGVHKILGENINVYLIIVGDGPLMEQLREYVKLLGIDEKVKLPGFKNDVNRYYNLFDIFVMTSLHEGIPMSLLEAMCMNKPIVSTRVGGVPEIIEDKYNGMLISSGDSTELAKACLQILSNKELTKKIIFNARNDMEYKFSLKQNVCSISKLYQGLSLK